MESNPLSSPPAPFALDSDPTIVIANLLPSYWVQGGGAVLANGVLLSAREVDIVSAISHGFSNRQIANRLHLAESTVRSNVSHVRQQLHLNRIQLALLWDQIWRTADGPRL